MVGVRVDVTELHIVVPCADRKRAAAGKPVRLRSVKRGPVVERCAAWWSALQAAKPVMPARDLYVGDHWAIARDLPSAASARGYHPHLWVASAGYGLISETTPLASYSATFAVDSPDTVLRSTDEPSSATQAWWSQLGKRRLRGHSDARSLSDLAASTKRAMVLMLVASSTYVRALEDDLENIARANAKCRLLIITGSPGPKSDALREFWVPTAANLRMLLGGSLTSVHSRLARRLLQDVPPNKLDVASARRHSKRLSARAPRLPKFERTRSDDTDVVTFIRSALRRDENASHTKLLRNFRASGRACEQGRFRELFRAEGRER